MSGRNWSRAPFDPDNETRPLTKEDQDVSQLVARAFRSSQVLASSFTRWT